MKDYTPRDVRLIAEEFNVSHGFFHITSLDPSLRTPNGRQLADILQLPLQKNNPLDSYDYFDRPTLCERTICQNPEVFLHAPKDQLFSFFESWSLHATTPQHIYLFYGEGTRFNLSGKPMFWDNLTFFRFNDNDFGREGFYGTDNGLLDEQRKVLGISPTYYSMEQVLETARVGDARFIEGEIFFPTPDLSKSPHKLSKQLGIQYAVGKEQIDRFQPYIYPLNEWSTRLPGIHEFKFKGQASFQSTMIKMVEGGQTLPHVVNVTLAADIHYGLGLLSTLLWAMGDDVEPEKPNPKDPYDGISSMRSTVFTGVPNVFDSQGRVVSWKYKLVGGSGSSGH